MATDDSADGNVEINEEAIHAIRDYIDIVNTSRNNNQQTQQGGFRSNRKTPPDPSDTNCNALDRAIDNITLKVAASAGKHFTKPQPEGVTVGHTWDDEALDSKDQFSYITSRINKTEANSHIESRQLEDPPIDIRSLSSESTISGNDNEAMALNTMSDSSHLAEGSLLCSFDTAGQYFIVQPDVADFQSFCSLHTQRRALGHVLEVTDEDSFTQQLSTIPDVTDEDDSTIQSSNQGLEKAPKSETLERSRDDEDKCVSSSSQNSTESYALTFPSVNEARTTSVSHIESVNLSSNNELINATLEFSELGNEANDFVRNSRNSLGSKATSTVSTYTSPQQLISAPPTDSCEFDTTGSTVEKNTKDPTVSSFSDPLAQPQPRQYYLSQGRTGSDEEFCDYAHGKSTSTWSSNDVRYEVHSGQDDQPMRNEDEKKEDVSHWGLYTFDSATGYLFPLLAGSFASSEQSQKNFGKLIRFAYPHVRNKQPGAFVVTRILSEAQKLKLPLYSIDRYLEVNSNLANNMKNEENQLELHDEEEEIIRYVVNLGVMAESMFGIKDDQPIKSLLSCSSDGEAIEIDLNEGFIDKQYAPDIEDELDEFLVHEDFVVSEPSPLYNRTLLNQQSRSKKPSPKSPGINHSKKDYSLNEEINRFWTGRSEKHFDRRYKQPMTKRKPRYSMEDIGSLYSASTGTSFGSYSQTVDTEDEERWRANGTMARLLQRSKKTKSKATASFFQQCRLNANESQSISAVQAASSLLEDGLSIKSLRPSLPQVWKLSYVDRTQPHLGYFDVDVCSLYDSCKVNRRGHILDSKPWELRVVNQRFLDEQSLLFSRNWFGSITKIEGNSKIKHRACRIKSMEMPTRAEEWTKEWYKKQWANPLPSNLSETNLSSTTVQKATPTCEPSSPGPHGTGKSHASEEESLWEEIPECGKLRNVQVRPGERISRVSPNLTSYLRRSRWRKKHFPRGSCPYK